MLKANTAPNSSIENEVDGEAFLLLTDEQLQLLVKAIGAQMKLIKRRDKLNGFTPSFSSSLTVSF